jgi:hypothetical protein
VCDRVTSELVVGVLRPWTGAVFPTKFGMFDNGKVSGLAVVDGKGGVEVLACETKDKGVGHFREFVQQLKASYSLVRFWSVLNSDLIVILWRYGFVSAYDLDEFGEYTDCMDWRKAK